MANQISIAARWEEGLRFVISTESGHEIVLDGDPEHGGVEAGPRPMEVLLAAVAGCTGMDVISLLQKMRQEVTSYAVRVTGTRSPEGETPRPYEAVVVEHVVTGKVEPDKLARAVELSDTKHCSAEATLRRQVEIEVRHTTAGSAH